jgi:hypothetical protein
MSSMQPYVTQFTWQYLGPGNTQVVKCQLAIHDVSIIIRFVNEWGSDTKYSFAFWTSTSDSENDATISASASVVKGQLSYMRLLRTCLEAIRDFADTHQVTQIDLSGSDSDPAKSAQKTRIYFELFKANANMFTDFKVTQPDAQKVLLVRKSNADSTGITDTP